MAIITPRLETAGPWELKTQVILFKILPYNRVSQSVIHVSPGEREELGGGTLHWGLAACLLLFCLCTKKRKK